VKRTLGKTVELCLWFAGSCMTIVWSGWWVVAMIWTKKFHVAALFVIVVSLAIAYEGFSIFNAERKSH
jgi:hypothetical protein